METNFYALIVATLHRHASRELLRWPGADDRTVAYTGADLHARVTALRTWLHGRGVRPGQSVLLAIPVGVSLVCALLAVGSLGAIPVLPPARRIGPGGWWAWLRALRQTAGRGLVLVVRPPGGRTGRWLIRSLGLRLTVLPPEAALLAAATPSWEAVPVPPEQPALISHSSGSVTGRPTAVRRTHAVLHAQHAALQAAFPPWDGQRDFPLFPNILLHNLALTEAGVVSILPAIPWGRFPRLDPARVVAQLVAEQVETLTGNITYFQLLMPTLRALSAGALARVRAVGVGGSPVPEPLTQALRAIFSAATVYVIYGTSEAEPIAVRPVTGGPLDPRLGYGVGVLHPAIEWQLAPAGQLILPDGTRPAVGELWVRGPHVATGPDGWLHTGDFGYVTSANELFLTARRGNAAVVRPGIQHYQVEHVLRRLAGIERVAARSTADGRGFQLYIQGLAAAEPVRATLLAAFGRDLATGGISYRTRLPVDPRHHAKIRYDRL